MWKGKLSEAKASGNPIKIQEAQVLNAVSFLPKGREKNLGSIAFDKPEHLIICFNNCHACRIWLFCMILCSLLTNVFSIPFMDMSCASKRITSSSDVFF